MKALILAAGFGTRLAPLTDRTPKPLLKIGDWRVIEFALDRLARAGISEVVVNLHHLGEQIREYLGDGSRYGMSIEYSPEAEILGTGGGIAAARELLGEEPFIVYNSDAVSDFDVSKLIARHESSGGCTTMVLRKQPAGEDYGLLGVDDDDFVRTILGKPESAAPKVTRELMFCGIHLVAPHVYDYVKPEFGSVISDYYIPALEAGAQIVAVENAAYFNDVGTPQRLRKAAEDMESGELEPPAFTR